MSNIQTDVLTIEVSDIEIKERLGGGQFGDVYRGVWQGTTAVALKKLKNIGQFESFVTEASMLSYEIF